MQETVNLYIQATERLWNSVSLSPLALNVHQSE